MSRLSAELICVSETISKRKQKWDIEKSNFVESDCRYDGSTLSRTGEIYAASRKLMIFFSNDFISN